MDYLKLPDNALLRVDKIVRPDGPVPYRRTKWLDLVRAGEAPAPAVARHRFTAWRWGDVRAWLDQMAGTA